MNEIISEREARWPFCLVCNKPVDGYDVDFNVELVKGRFGCHDGQYVAGRYTTYRIRCQHCRKPDHPAEHEEGAEAAVQGGRREGGIAFGTASERLRYWYC